MMRAGVTQDYKSGKDVKKKPPKNCLCLSGGTTGPKDFFLNRQKHYKINSKNSRINNLNIYNLVNK